MTNTMTTTDQKGRRTVWAAGLLVAAAAGAATAHGLYQVAAAARVPTPIAWLYPLITDGLALVAYAATSRLVEAGRRYAAAIVVLAAGLSGLAQAVYLAGGIAQASAAPVGLRFGVGAWPAVAAALTAHLLHLISTGPANGSCDTVTATGHPSSFPAASTPPRAQPPNETGSPDGVQPPRTSTGPDPSAVRPARSTSHEQPRAREQSRPADAGIGSTGGSAPARDRARQAARSHYAEHERLPTVTELMHLAQVARGTAGAVLKDLRAERPALHVVTVHPKDRTQP